MKITWNKGVLGFHLRLLLPSWLLKKDWRDSVASWGFVRRSWRKGPFSADFEAKRNG